MGCIYIGSIYSGNIFYFNNRSNTKESTLVGRFVLK
jgi:hypothetical protein